MYQIPAVVDVRNTDREDVVVVGAARRVRQHFHILAFLRDPDPVPMDVAGVIHIPSQYSTTRFGHCQAQSQINFATTLSNSSISISDIFDTSDDRSRRFARKNANRLDGTFHR